MLIVGAVILITVRMVSAQNQNILQDAEMKETSGIAASRINKNTFYVHNDSGDTSRFFAISPNGQLKETFEFKGDAIDCEDIAVGPGPVKGKSYVYLGDIGDNHHQRRTIEIYRFAEPEITSAKTAHLQASTYYFKYPDGPRDAETLMIDPVDRQLYIVSKREDSVGVYTAPLNVSVTDTTTLKLQCKLHFKGLPLLKWITAGDISADGKQILLRSYQNIYYWKRNPGEPVWKAMQSKPQELKHNAEKQGEAIGFTADGKGFYTTSEGKNAPIYFYQTPK